MYLEWQDHVRYASPYGLQVLWASEWIGAGSGTGDIDILDVKYVGLV